jgi:hypothetical protein
MSLKSTSKIIPVKPDIRSSAGVVLPPVALLASGSWDTVDSGRPSAFISADGSANDEHIAVKS